MIAKVVPIKPDASHTLADAPAVLRAIADDLQKEIELLGEGCICRVVVVVRVSGSEPRVHAAGNVEHMAQAYMDLQAGAQQLMNMPRPRVGLPRLVSRRPHPLSKLTPQGPNERDCMGR